MLKRRKQLLGVLLVFLVLFTYRFSFREDFRILEIIQITLSTLSDVLVVVVTLKVIALFQKYSESIKSPRWQYGLLTVVGIVAYWCGVQILISLHRTIYSITTGISEPFKAIFESLSYQVFDSYLVLAVGMIILISYQLYGAWLTQRTLAERSEKERIQAELNYLKGQINPHFIFNTLNNLHFLVEESNVKARKLIQDFCDLLRYQLYKTGGKDVLLEDDAKFLKQYVEIQKVRKEDGFRVDYGEFGIDGVRIAPLLLIIPLENAFKYSPNSASSYVKIDLKVENNILNYTVENPVSEKVYSEQASGGLGLDNLRKRLFLIYGNRAEFSIFINEGVAKAELSIKLDANEA